MKKYLLVAILAAMFLLSPYIITPIVYKYLVNDFVLEVEHSIEQEANGRKFCIIAPVLNNKTREWQVVESISDVNLYHVVDHAVREKLIFFAKEGRSLKQRAKHGKEMHFGVLFEKQLYIWSFKQSKLIALPFVPHRLASTLREHYLAIVDSNNKGLLPNRIDPSIYYCPHLHD